ncbi:type III secretion protein Q [Pseudomonas yamanorum]|nr:type III secretion protein Q [Pseudomonas yamanorum]
MQVFNTIGRGLSLPFEVDGLDGQLLLDNVSSGTESITGSRISSICGPLILHDNGQVLSLLGRCPIRLPAAADDWVWALYNTGLSPVLQELFGSLGAAADGPFHGPPCRLQVQLGTQRHECTIQLPAATLIAMTTRACWRPMIPASNLLLRVFLPVIIGELHLSMGQLQRLRPGDVLMPEHLRFTPQGVGVWLPSRTPWPVRITHARQQVWLHLTTGDTHMDPAFDPEMIQANEAAYEPYADMTHEAYPQDGHVSNEDHADIEDNKPWESSALGHFSDLLLPLSIRCGHLQLSLYELQRLAPGSVLPILGAAPGEAALYHGERRLAYGELVQIDDGLGMQITRLDTLA